MADRISNIHWAVVDKADESILEDVNGQLQVYGSREEARRRKRCWNKVEKVFIYDIDMEADND